MLGNFTKKNKGFTLIELLVVIFIIGLLATISLVVIMGARSKAKDARIKADISQVRAIAQLILSDYESYAGLCDASNTLNGDVTWLPYGPQLKVIEDDIELQQGVALVLSCYTGTSPNRYCVSADLIASGAGFYCIDSTGVAVEYSADNCTGASLDCTP